MKRQKIKKQYLLHLIPYVVFTIFLIVIVKTNGYDTSDIVPSLLKHHPLVVIVFSLCNHFLGPIYILFSIRILRKHRENIGKWFSSTKNIDLNWLRYILIANIIIWALVVLISILGFSSDLINEKSAEYTILTAMTLSVFFLGFFGIKQQVIYSIPKVNGNSVVKNESNISSLLETTSKDETTPKYGKSGLSDDMASQIYANLGTLVKENAIYKNEALTLLELAKQLKVHPNHLSQVINEMEGKNFYNYINALRIKEFIKIASLPENKKYTMISLAYDCGFSTKSTFNKHFKLHTGKTPTEFLNT